VLRSKAPVSEYSVDRYYDPSTGQFLSVDPMVATTGQAYAYTGDDPVNDSDPSGLAKGGPKRTRSTEFQDWSNEEVQNAYDALTGRLTPAQNQEKQKLIAELKSRNLRRSSGGSTPTRMVSIPPSAALNQGPTMITQAQFQAGVKVTVETGVGILGIFVLVALLAGAPAGV
jgi:uncharacterized protein RhaS with RHS repeats